MCVVCSIAEMTDPVKVLCCHEMIIDFNTPTDFLDVIEAWGSFCVWVLVSHPFSHAIDIPFKVIDAVESSSEGLWIVVDKILHSLEDTRRVSEPLQGYCTIVCDTCQVPLYDTERRMISNGDDRVSEVFQRGWHLLASVLRVQLVETFREGLNTQIDLF